MLQDTTDRDAVIAFLKRQSAKSFAAIVTEASREFSGSWGSDTIIRGCAELVEDAEAEDLALHGPEISS